MRKFIIPIIVALGLSLTACGGGDSTSAPQQSTRTVTASPSPSSPQFSANDRIFIAVIRQRFHVTIPGAKIVSLGQSVCQNFEQYGVTRSNVLAYAKGFTQNGQFTYEDAGFFIGASTQAYCPAIGKRIQSLFGSGSVV